MRFLVDVGQLIEVRAATEHDAAMLALFARDSRCTLPEPIFVWRRADFDQVPSIFTLDALPCRICGCTEQRACRGGCAWAVPGICTRCFIPQPAAPARYALET